MEPLDLTSTYLDLRADGDVAPITVDASFWEDISSGARTDMDGTTVSAHDYTGDWSWERHPSGDEVVLLLSGAATFVLEVDGDEQRVHLRAGEAVVVPRGTWHRAEVGEPTRAVHITPGAGTDHRPR